MGGYVTGVFRGLGRYVWRRPIVSAFVCAIVVLAFVPVWPYKPHCGTFGTTRFGTLEGDMTPEFLAAMEINLSDLGIAYWRIGDHIYVRLLAGLLPEGVSTSAGSHGVLDAELSAVAGLVTPPINVNSFAGKELLGRTYQPPAYLTKLYEQDESLVFGDDCTFIRAVAFGERPPPGYVPKPSPFRRSSE